MALASIAAYVLAGGQSSRMGQDKALLSLAGRPLVQHAVEKLRRLTGEVAILGSRPELAPFAPLVPDLRESCGPLGGIEAALAHTRRDWILVAPVDMPFLPAALLQRWAGRVLSQDRARASLFVIDGVPQPALCLLHREMKPFLEEAAQRGRFKLYPVLEEAARVLAHRHSNSSEATLLCFPCESSSACALFAELADGEGEGQLTERQRAASRFWFANLNTPEEFAEAHFHLDVLDA